MPKHVKARAPHDGREEQAVRKLAYRHHASMHRRLDLARPHGSGKLSGQDP